MTGAKAEEKPWEQLARIDDFLAEYFPKDLTAAADPNGSNTADVVIRLLTRLAAQGNAVARCGAEYCNQPEGHKTPHGWINVDPTTANVG